MQDPGSSPNLKRNSWKIQASSHSHVHGDSTAFSRLLRCCKFGSKPRNPSHRCLGFSIHLYSTPKKNIYKETWQFHKGNKNGLPQFLLNFFGKESFKSAFFTAPFFMVQMAWGAGGEMFRILIDATWLMGYPSYWLHLVTINKPPRYATDVLVDFRRRDVSPSSLEQPTGNYREHPLVTSWTSNSTRSPSFKATRLTKSEWLTPQSIIMTWCEWVFLKFT